jgi:catechol 2,3-dioxygenase-like lactoylglutathione lyase family enzyme
MALNLMEHYLVLTDDIEQTRTFYREVLGLEDGFRPPLEFPGYWLYLKQIPVLHIAEWETYTAHSNNLGIPVTSRAKGTGAFDHIAFNGTDPEAMISKLETGKIPYDRNDVPHASLVQLFLNDPNGVKIELNFDTRPCKG